MEKDKVKVTMTVEALENMLFHVAYKASRKSNDELFKGLLPFLNKMNDDLEKIVLEQDYIKLLLQNSNMKEYEDGK